MGDYYKIEEMLEDELQKIASAGKLTTSSLEVGDKAAHFLKSIKTIEAMSEGGESYDDYSMRSGRMYSGRSYDGGMNMGGGTAGGSYARGNGRGRGSNARRDSMGRYSSARGYSGHGNKQDLMMEIEELKQQLEEMED